MNFTLWSSQCKDNVSKNLLSVISDQIEELEYEEDFDVTEQLRKLDLELENDGEASELLNLGSFWLSNWWYFDVGDIFVTKNAISL